MKDVGLQFLLLFESGFGSRVMLALWNILECVPFKNYSLGEICQVGVTSLYVFVVTNGAVVMLGSSCQLGTT